VVAGAAVIVVVAGVVAVVLLHEPGNVSHPGLSFTTSTTATATTPPPKRHVTVNNFLWPRYGLDAGRTRAFEGPRALHPPFHTGWVHNDYALLEFPPVIYRNTMYFMNDAGWAKAMNVLTGHVLWQRRIGTLGAASPAIGVRERMIFLPVLSTSGSSPGNGRIVGLSMRSGAIVWSRNLPSGSESSPIVWDKTLYFGDQGGTVYSLNAATGAVNWTYHASGAVKGGPAYVDNRLYFGDYAGRAYAVSATTGHQVWAVGTNGAHFGFGSGQFYATPAVAFGRVYMGNTDGRVYSFGARNGALAWATATGAYVYASASVADPAGAGPTVYVGSYDGSFYAFNAQSGSIRWRHPSGGKISGSSTVIGDVVYYSDLGTKSTIGLDAATGRKVFGFPDGAFTPVIADYHAIYLDGYTKLYQLLPGRHAVAHHHHKQQRKAKAKARRHHRAVKHKARQAKRKAHRKKRSSGG
jgi:outer membrane protein assembly factor BamB